MKKGRIQVDVGQGSFSSERAVSFVAAGKKYSLVVDESDIENGMLVVYVVEEMGEEAIVDLPRETFTTGSRIRVPRVLVQEAA
jgi:hypothetical protein